MGREGEAVLRLRPATRDDLPRILELLRSAHLPTAQVEEFIDSFIVAQRGELTAGCGGLELYEGTAVLRSVVVDESERGSGLGRRIAEQLEARALEAGAPDLFLFTIDAWHFWQHLGYEEIGLADWPQAPRRCWQYRYVSSHQEEFRQMGLRSMRKLRGRSEMGTFATGSTPARAGG